MGVKAEALVSGPTARKRGVGRYLPAVIVLLGGTALSISLFIMMRHSIKARLKDEFDRRAGNYERIIHTTLDSCSGTLASLAEFFNSTDEVTRAEFKTYVGTALSRQQEIMSLGYVARVRDAQRARFEQTARMQGLRDFEVRERDENGGLAKAPKHEEYYPLYYEENASASESSLGFDLASDSARRLALERARDSGRPSQTAPLRLLHAPDYDDGIIIFQPVYKKGAAVDTEADRQKNLTGLVLLSYRVGELIPVAFNHVPSFGLDTYIYDASATPDERLIYYLPARVDGHGSSNPESDEHQRLGMRWSTRLEIAGQSWGLAFRPTGEFLTALESWDDWLVLASGLAMTVLVTAYLVIVANRAAWIEGVVANRTLELRFANESLRNEVQARMRYEAELAAANEKLNKLAREDVLTGLFNRRTVLDQALSEWARWQRYRRPFSLLVIDVDNFKSINDRFGHPCGDQALKLISKQLQLAIRSVDTIGRYGGEEFLVILPSTNIVGAVAAGEKIVQSIRQLSLEFNQQSMSLTVSVGAAAASPSDNSLDELLNRADTALYAAKRQGKNRVVADRRPSDTDVLTEAAN